MFAFRVQTGSGYTIYDNGMNPDKTVLETSKRRELAFVTYDYDDMGPGKMIVSRTAWWCGLLL